MMSGLLPWSVFAAFGGVLVTLGTVALHKRIERRRVLVVVVVAYAIRTFTVPVFYSTLLSGSGGFAYSDDRNFHEVSSALASRPLSGFSTAVAQLDYRAVKNDGYFWLTTLLYKLMSPNTLVGRQLNAILGAFVVLMFILLAEEIAPQRRAAGWGLVLALLPDHVFWSALQFKDMTVSLIVVTGFWYWVRRASDIPAVRDILVLGGLSVVLAFFRAESALVLAGALWLYSFFRLKAGSRSRHILGAVTLLAVAVVGSRWLMSHGARIGVAGTTLFTGDASPRAVLSDFALLLRGSSDIPGTGFLRLGFVRNAAQLWRLPIAGFFSLYTPFPPWPQGAHEASDILALASIPWLIAVPLLVRSVWSLLKLAPEWRLPGWYVLGQWLALSLFLYAFSPTRHRVELIPLFLLGVVAFEQRHGLVRVVRWLAIGVGTLGIMMMAYVIMAR